MKSDAVLRSRASIPTKFEVRNKKLNKMIELVDITIPIPGWSRCQEALTMYENYIPCNKFAVAVIWNKKENRAYYMCPECANYSIAKGGKLLRVVTNFKGLAHGLSPDAYSVD